MEHSQHQSECINMQRKKSFTNAFCNERFSLNLSNFSFSLNRNSIHGSAICAFNISSIHAAFSGPFKHQESINSAWERQELPNRAHFECKVNKGTNFRHNQLLDSSRYQLMDQAVQPTTTYPLHVSKLERFIHIALDNISTKLHENVRIIYVSTDSGLIKKISVLPRTKETCVIEMWQPDVNNARIRVIDFLKVWNIETSELHGMHNKINFYFLLCRRRNLYTSEVIRVC